MRMGLHYLQQLPGVEIDLPNEKMCGNKNQLEVNYCMSPINKNIFFSAIARAIYKKHGCLEIAC